MKIRNIVVALIFVVTMREISIGAGEEIDLRLKFVIGEKYLYSSEFTQKVTQYIHEEDQTILLKIEIDQLEEISNIDSSGNYLIEIIYDRIHVKQTYGQISSEYDSRDHNQYVDPAMRSFAWMVGKKFQILLNPKGEVLEIIGADALIDSIIAVMDIPESPQRESVINDIKGRFGAAALKQSIEQTTDYFPVGPVQVGNSWETESVLNYGFSMKFVSQYTLISVADGIGTISDSSLVTSVPEYSRLDFGDISSEYQISGTRTGMIKVDLDTGLAIEIESSSQFSGTMSISSETSGTNQTWPIRAEGQAKISFARRN